MNVTNLKRMTAEQYAVWSERQEAGRYELIDGLVVQMKAENAAHSRAKLRIAMNLSAALKQRQILGEVYGDGMAVRIANEIVLEPDAIVRLGAQLPDDTTLVTDPMIVVEVLTSRSGPLDSGRRLSHYFLLASVHHYLVVDTTKAAVLHYVRGPGGLPHMHAPIDKGDIVLTPPGLTIPIAEIFDSLT